MAICFMVTAVSSLSTIELLAQEEGSASTVPAAQPATDALMDLPTALRRTLALHPAVRQLEARVDQRIAEERILRSDRLPVVDYSLAPGFDPQSNRDASMQLTVTARQMVWDFGENRAQRNAAAHRTDRDRYLFASSAESVAGKLTAHFVALAKWDAVIAASNLQLAELDLIRGRIDRRIASGLADVSDLKRADIALQRAHIELQQNLTRAKLEADNIRMLSMMVGTPQTDIDQNERLFFKAPENALPDDVPEIAAARSEWDAALDVARSARASRLPAISVGVTNSSYLLSKDVAGRGGASVSNTTRFGLFLTGRLSLGGRAGQQVKAAAAGAASAQSEYENQKLQLQLNLATFERDIADAEARMTGAEMVEATLAQARDLYWQEYLLSKRRLTEVFDIEREIYQARVDKLTAREDRLRSIMAILGTTGRLIEHIMGGQKHD